MVSLKFKRHVITIASALPTRANLISCSKLPPVLLRLKRQSCTSATLPCLHTPDRRIQTALNVATSYVARSVDGLVAKRGHGHILRSFGRHQAKAAGV